MELSNLIHLRPGWDARGSDGRTIGAVEELGPGYIVVSRGILVRTELFVPFQAIEDADPEAAAVGSTFRHRTWTTWAGRNRSSTQAAETDGDSDAGAYVAGCPALTWRQGRRHVPPGRIDP